MAAMDEMDEMDAMDEACSRTVDVAALQGFCNHNGSKPVRAAHKQDPDWSEFDFPPLVE